MQSPASTYAATSTQTDGVGIVRLSGPSGVSVSIVPGIGNNAFEFAVNGKNAFWFPYSSVGELAADPALCGNPLLAPWANRLDEHGFHFGGRHYVLNRTLGNYLLDQCGQPIHGLLLYADQWEVVSLRADADSARVTSRLEFSRHPALMAQFPYAHDLEMTYVLEGRTLETRTKVSNHGKEAMPLSLGFHPYFQLHDSPRDAWRIRLAADDVWELNDRFTPTGARVPIGSMFPRADDLSLRGLFLDHVFGGLQRDDDGWARFAVEGADEKITVAYGAGYPVAVVYAPIGEGQSFICFEPMTGVTNAFNLAHAGRYDDLPSISPGGEWQAAYRISVDGF